MHQKNHFYVQDNTNRPFFMPEGGYELQIIDSSTHTYCEECYNDHIKILEKEDTLYIQNKPLQALEIFSGLFLISIIMSELLTYPKGAGGLSIGLEESRFIKTRWAIEYAPSAAKTFQ